MKLLIDEDLGSGLAKAAVLLGLCQAATWPRKALKTQLRRKGRVEDTDWIPFAGMGSWLVVSCNVAILDTEAEIELWNQCRVGGIFVPNGADALSVFGMLMRRRQWLETIDATEPRAFAYHVPIQGKPRRDLRASPLA